VLRLPTERLAIALCPDRIGIARKPAVWGRRPLSVLSIATGAEEWQPALDALAGWIETEEGKVASATVTVSNRWARFALMPWSDEVGSEDEEQALGRACLESAYGDLNGWTLGLAQGRYGQPRIVCALETAFLQRLRSILREHDITCRGIWPYFLPALRQAQPLLLAAVGFLAVAESETVVLASARHGRWHSLRSARSTLSPATLVQLLEREPLLQGIAEKPALGVVAPGMDQAEMPTVTLLRQETMASTPAEIMALETVVLTTRMPIDFAPKTWSAGKLGGMLGLVAILGAAAWSGWNYVQLRQQQEAWRADWQRLSSAADTAHAERLPEDREHLMVELRFASQVIEKLDAPWDVLFGGVEEVFNEQVTLLSVEPDTERREVRLVAEAKDMAAMLDYVRQVRQSSAFKEGYLVDHQINQQDPQHPVRFTIMARWVAHLPADASSGKPTTSATNMEGAEQ
jgi:Tfp pilus assembly protein PilN